MVEKEVNVEQEQTRCSWCGQIDTEEKLYASPGDDIENPKAYHKDCFESLQAFMLLVWTNSEESVERLMDMADRVSGNKRRKMMRRK